MKFPTLTILAVAASLTLHAKESDSATKSVTTKEFGTHEGTKAHLFTFSNKAGMEAVVSDWGATLISLKVPDKNGKISDVTHGYDADDFEGWVGDGSYFGATVGRFGNRIANGKFTLDGKEYKLATNNDPGGISCHLHGGLKGFNKKVWKSEAVSKDGARGVKFTYLSKDGEEGYPGNLTTVVTYWLTDKNELIWDATATTDKATPINIVHHSYWNLGDPTKSINDHQLQLFADHYLPTNKGMIPTGEIAKVEGTPMDFTQPTAIGLRLDADFEALKLGGGYDHCWVLRDGDGVRPAAKLHDPKSGRTMEVHTTQPGIQFYGGNFLGGNAEGKNGLKYGKRSAACLETQAFPDSPNKPEFPSCILKPGETYKHTLVHKFSW